MIATVDVADLGRRSLIRALRGRPRRSEVPGLRWLDVAPAAALASSRPPGLRRAVLFAMWDDEHSAQAFSETHQLAGRFAGDGFHAVLRPLARVRVLARSPLGHLPQSRDRSRRSRDRHHARSAADQPSAAVSAHQPSPERAALTSDGFVWGTAAARPPFVATLSVWSSEDSAAAYAYSDPNAGHPRAITKQRRRDFHHESAFVRYAVTSSTGTLPGAPPIEFTPDRET